MDLGIRPKRVVISEANTIQSHQFRALYQFIHTHETIIRARVTMGVKIYQQELIVWPQ